MNLLEELATKGVNIEEGLARLGGNAAFYERMLGKFVDTMEKYHVDADFDEKDYNEITEKAHSIKGASGNLSITPVYQAYTEIVNELRAGRPQSAKRLIEEIQPVQEEILTCITRHMQE